MGGLGLLSSPGSALTGNVHGIFTSFEIKRKLKMYYMPDDAQCASQSTCTTQLTHVNFLRNRDVFMSCQYQSQSRKKRIFTKNFVKMISQKFGNEILQPSFLYPFDTYSSLCDFFFSKQNLSKRKNACSTKKGQRKLVIFPFLKFICYVRIFCNRIRLQQL